MSRIAYILNARVPSNNGHVIQTVRMCEGFSKAGHDVVLYHADRKQIDIELAGVDVQDYLGVTHRFQTRTIPYVDVNYLHERVNSSLLRPFIIASHVLFTLMATGCMWLTDADLYVTREWPVAFLLVKLGLPTVFEIHKLEGKAFSNRGQRAIGSIGANDALRAVVTLTEPTAAGLVERGIPREKVHTDPDAVNLEQYDPPESVESARGAVELPADQFLVGYTGSLHPGKGAYELAKACSALSGVSVVFVGGTKQEIVAFRTYLRREAIQNAIVVGAVPPTDVPQYQWACNALALPPSADGDSQKHHPESTSPLKLFEYMAAGRPIVATRLPGIESVLEHEVSALLVPPDDVLELRRAVQRVRNSPELAASLVARASTDVMDYTWEARAQRIVSTALGEEPEP